MARYIKALPPSKSANAKPRKLARQNKLRLTTVDGLRHLKGAHPAEYIHTTARYLAGFFDDTKVQAAETAAHKTSIKARRSMLADRANRYEIADVDYQQREMQRHIEMASPRGNEHLIRQFQKTPNAAIRRGAERIIHRLNSKTLRPDHIQPLVGTALAHFRHAGEGVVKQKDKNGLEAAANRAFRRWTKNRIQSAEI